MKEFSKKWKASKNPSKKRKFLAKAPIHIKRKLLSVNLSKDLRKKYETRNVVVRKGDKVKVSRGKYKGTSGKVIKVQTKKLKVYIEGIQTTKLDGSKVDVPMRPSNLQIIELHLEDKKRMKKGKIETTKNTNSKEDIKEKENKK
jgi:large subunit ribosomal protein L24